MHGPPPTQGPPQPPNFPHRRPSPNPSAPPIRPSSGGSMVPGSGFSTPQQAPPQNSTGNVGGGPPAVALFQNAAAFSNPAPSQPSLAGGMNPTGPPPTNVAAVTTPSTRSLGGATTPQGTAPSSAVRSNSPRIYVRPRPLPRPPKRGGASTPTRTPLTSTSMGTPAPSSAASGGGTSLRLSPAPRSGGHRYRLPPVRPKRGNTPTTPSQTSTPVGTPQASPRMQPMAVTQSPPLVSAPVAQKTPALPEGWQQLTNKEGRFYFYHAASGQTTWDRPTDVSSSSTAVEPTTTAGSVGGGEETPKITVNDADAEPSTEPPQAVVAEPTAAPALPELDPQPSVTPSEPEPAASQTPEESLSEGWEESKDPSGRSYYYNAASGETTWDRPTRTVPTQTETVNPTSLVQESSTHVVDGANDEAVPIPIAAESQSTTPDAAGATPAALPPGWVEATDPTHGRAYYYNAETGATSWERPQMVIPTEHSTNETLAEPSASNEHEPENSSVVATKETVDQVPVAQPDSVGETVPTVQEPTDGIDVAEEASTFEVAAETEVPANEGALLPGWIEASDPTHGRMYYYNSETGETTWDRPTAPSAVEADVPQDSSVPDEAIQADEQTETHDSTLETKGVSVSSEEHTGEVSVAAASADDKKQSSDKLPAGWEEATDPTNGTTYYYNSQTGESSWELPKSPETNIPSTAGRDSVEIPAEDEPSSQLAEETPLEDIAVEEAVDVATSEASTPQETNELPPGWVESTDPSTGRSYYFNADTGDTSWELPAMSTPVEEETKVESNVAEIVEPSPNESADDQGETPTENSGLTLGAEETSISPSAKENSPEAVECAVGDELAPGWVEGTDPGSGQIYYYNSETQETSWERPSVAAEIPEQTTSVNPMDAEGVATSIPVVEETVNKVEATSTASVDLDSNQDVADPSIPASADKLPPGWVEATDPTSEQLYYYNAETGATSWTLPLSERDKDEQVLEGTELEPSPTAVEEMLEETSKPVSEVLDNPNNEISEESSTVQANEGLPVESLPSSDELPVGWVEVTDPTSGSTYFYNEQTQETSWERPRVIDTSNSDASKEVVEQTLDSTIVEAGSKISEFDVSAAQSQETEETPITSEAKEDLGDPSVSASLKELPNGWVEATDPTTGQTYYFNSESGTTSWEFPQMKTLSPEVEDDEAHDTSIPAEHPEIERIEDTKASVGADREEKETNPSISSAHRLPPGWVEATDPTSGQTYYYNAESGETSWELPKSMSVAPESDSMEEVAEESDKSLPAEALHESPIQIKDDIAEEGAQAETTPEEHIPDSSVANSQDEAHLPSGWTEVTDPSSGKAYYYNESTGTTSWENPSMEPQSQEDANSKNASTEPRVDAERDILGPDEKGDSGRVEENGPTDAEVENDPAEEVENDPTEQAVSTPADPLPRGWVEMSDPNSGQAYYYNEDTGATSWDIPTISPGPDEHGFESEGNVDPSSTLSDEVLGETPVAAVDVAKETLGSSSIQELERPEASAVVSEDELPSGWVETADPTSGQSYFYNADTQETSWTRPTMNLPTTGVENVELADNNEPVWAENVDDQHAPEESADQEAEEDSAGVTALQADAVLEETEATTVHSASESGTGEVLPPGWVELTDPTSGQTYYFNERSEETSWDRPVVHTGSSYTSNESKIGKSAETAPLEAAGKSERTSEAAAPAEVEETKSPEKDDIGNHPQSSEMPTGWVEAVDSNNGQTYYYNEETGESSWERPSVAPPTSDITASGPTETLVSLSLKAPPEEPEEENQVEPESENEPPVVKMESEKAELDVEPKDSSEQLDLLPSGWAEATVPESGELYYYNSVTGESSYDRPKFVRSPSSAENPVGGEPEFIDEPSSSTDPRVAETTTIAEVPLNVVGHEEIPPGWSKIVDEASGQIYFYNEETGETAWEPPSHKVDDGASESVVPSQIEDQQTQLESSSKNLENSGESAQDESSANANSLSVKDLPDGWVEAIDPSSGSLYYYHAESGATSWVRPGSDSGDAVASEMVNAPEQNVPSDWEEVKKPESTKEGNSRPSPNEGWEVVSKEPSITPTAPAVGRKPGPKLRDRSFHASAHLGFGGKLCQIVSGPDGKYRVKVQALHKSLETDGFVDATLEKQANGIFGPLHKSDEAVVRSYLENKETSDMLWRLIRIAASSKGKLRSLSGSTDPNSPESHIVRFLLEGGPEPAHRRMRHEKGAASDQLRSGVEANVSEIEDLLVNGKREEAVEMALRERQFALALLVAGMCGHETYQTAAKEFCENSLVQGSPLHTVAVMFCAPSQVNETSALFGDADRLQRSWKSHLAGIINNRIPGWESAVLALGDRLGEAGCFEAAHFCYMVSGIPISTPVQRGSKWTLVGCNVSPADVILRTDASIDAFLRTEAYEWAKRRGNANANIKALQAFKALYAVRLVEYGFLEDAMGYAASALECLGEPIRKQTSTIVEPTKPLGLAVLSTDKRALVAALHVLHNRLQICLQKDLFSEESVAVNEPSTQHITQPTYEESAPTPLLRKPEVVSSPKLAPEFTKQPETQKGQDKNYKNTMPQMFSKQQIEGSGAPPASQPDQRPAQSLRAPPQSMPVRLSGLETKTKGKGQGQKSLPPTTPMLDATPPRSKTGREESAPPAFMTQPKTAFTTPMAKDHKSRGAPSTTEPRGLGPEPVASGMETPVRKTGAVAPAPASAPPNLHKMAQPETPSSGGWLNGIKSYFTKKLNPDATTADLGGQMEAYFDEKAGRWIFPGDDPTEVPAALAPPPKTPVAEKAESALAPTPAPSNDPLAMMMAPPPSRLPGGKKAQARVAPVPRASAAMTGNTLPPQYAMFKPPS